MPLTWPQLAFVAIPFVMAMVWLVMVPCLFVWLARRHPGMHAALGSPSAFEPQATFALFRFLGSRRPESLGDARLRAYANLMRAWFVATQLFAVAAAVLVMGHAAIL